MIHFSVENHIATVKFDRPEALNAFNSEVMDELKGIIDQIEARKDEIRAVIFTGQGKAFVSGADLLEMENLRGEAVRAFASKGRDLFRRIELLPIPTIAAINGYCFGGGLEFALACHIRLASDKARMGLPEVSLGIIPGFSGTQRLPRAIGRANALYLMLTGKTIRADQALSLGLIQEAHPSEDLMEAAENLALAIAGNSKQAIEKLLLAVNHGQEIGLDAALELETGLMAMGFGTEDQIEGVKAFKEKRKAKFY